MMQEISVDVAVAAVLSPLDGIFALKEQPRMNLKAFLYWKVVFAALLSTSWLATKQ